MVTKSDQFTELQRKNIEAAMKLAQMSVDNSQRMVALQADVAKKLLEASVENAKALAAAKDGQEAMALRTRFTQDTAQMLLATARQMAEIGNATRSEFSRLLTEQLTSGSKDMIDVFQSFLGALPGSTPNLMETMQQAMANTDHAFEQIARATSKAFETNARQPDEKPDKQSKKQ